MKLDETAVSSPVVAEACLPPLATRRGVPYAVDTATGAEQWRFDSNDDQFTTVDTPAVVDGTVYVLKPIRGI